MTTAKTMAGGCSLQSLDMRWITPAEELPQAYQSVLVYGVLEGEMKADTHEGFLIGKGWVSVRTEETCFQGGQHPRINNVSFWAWMPKPHIAPHERRRGGEQNAD
jgi:hypothetical protein